MSSQGKDTAIDRATADVNRKLDDAFVSFCFMGSIGSTPGPMATIAIMRARGTSTIPDQFARDAVVCHNALQTRMKQGQAFHVAVHGARRDPAVKPAFERLIDHCLSQAEAAQ
jgi:hypothetical protein